VLKNYVIYYYFVEKNYIVFACFSLKKICAFFRMYFFLHEPPAHSARSIAADGHGFFDWLYHQMPNHRLLTGCLKWERGSLTGKMSSLNFSCKQSLCSAMQRPECLPRWMSLFFYSTGAGHFKYLSVFSVSPCEKMIIFVHLWKSAATIFVVMNARQAFQALLRLSSCVRGFTIFISLESPTLRIVPKSVPYSLKFYQTPSWYLQWICHISR